MTMTRQEYKEKLVRRFVFLHKLKGEDVVNQLMNTMDVEYLLLQQIHEKPLPESLMECNNQFLWIKKISRYAINIERETSRKLRELQGEYNAFVKSSGVTNINDFTPKQYDTYKSHIDSIDFMRSFNQTCKDQIIRLNGRLEYICRFYDSINLPLKDFATLCNINYFNALLNIENEDYDGDDNRHWTYLFQGIESDRSEEGWKYSKQGMPLFNFTTKYFMLMLDRNKEAKQKVDDFILFDLGMAEHAMVMAEDSEGNKTLEKYYPPLRAVK